MKKLIFILFIQFSFSSFAWGGDTTYVVKDFNNDGFKDSLLHYYEGGSGFGGRYVEVVNGKTKEKFSLTNDGCFCAIYQTIAIPPNLAKPANKAFLEAIKKVLLPYRKEKADNSLEWMIGGAFNNAQLDSNTFFDFVIKPKSTWTSDTIIIPENYYIELSGDTLNKMYHPYEKPDWYSKEKTKGVLVYYTHNHGGGPISNTSQITPIDSNKNYKIFTTSHGLFVKKGKLHKWLFVSDVNLTRAPSKLRWASMQRARVFGKHIILVQNLPPDGMPDIYIVNIETGTLARFKESYIKKQSNKFSFLQKAVKEKELIKEFKDCIKELQKNTK